MSTFDTIEAERHTTDRVPLCSKDIFCLPQLNPQPIFALNCPLSGGFPVGDTRAYAFIAPRCSVV